MGMDIEERNARRRTRYAIQSAEQLVHKLRLRIEVEPDPAKKAEFITLADEADATIADLIGLLEETRP
jgi:hypothetical protein